MIAVRSPGTCRPVSERCRRHARLGQCRATQRGMLLSHAYLARKFGRVGGGGQLRLVGGLVGGQLLQLLGASAQRSVGLGKLSLQVRIGRICGRCQRVARRRVQGNEPCARHGPATGPAAVRRRQLGPLIRRAVRVGASLPLCRHRARFCSKKRERNGRGNGKRSEGSTRPSAGRAVAVVPRQAVQ